MADIQKDRLKELMQKYIDRTCTMEERNELVEYIKQTSGPEALNGLWWEVWAETDGSVILDELSWEALNEKRVQRKRSNLQMVWMQVWKWSAVAAVLVGVYFMVDWYQNGADIMIYETGYGERMEVVLDDGTTVNLNADSKLTWDRNWEKKGLRQAKLEGEAYFNVSHVGSIDQMAFRDENMISDSSFRIPFEVLTSDVTIRVLGTAFNTIRRRGKTEVYLEKGVVELSLHPNEITGKRDLIRGERRELQKKKSDPKPDKTLDTLNVIRMQPGDWVSYSAIDDILIQKILDNGEEKTEWKDGVLSYRDVEFRVMLQNLEDIYGKSFEVSDQDLLTKRVNFGVPFKDWDTVTEMMEWMLGIEIMELGDNQIQIKKQKRN